MVKGKRNSLFFTEYPVKICWFLPLSAPYSKWSYHNAMQSECAHRLDRGYPSFGNFDSTIPIDVAGMKSYMDSLFDPTCVPVRVTINKVNLAPNRNMPRFISVLRNRRGLSTSKLCQSCSFILSRIDLPVSPIYTLLHSHGILQTKPFCFVSSKASLGRTKWDLSVVSNSKTVCLDVVGRGEEPLIHPFM